jgi:hypothetical protein
MVSNEIEPVRARLASGEIVVLEQDCDCVIHTGPHWLHMDDVDKRLNAPLRERAFQGEFLAVYAYAQAEQRRLASKLREMETRRIEEILR